MKFYETKTIYGYLICLGLLLSSVYFSSVLLCKETYKPQLFLIFFSQLLLYHYFRNSLLNTILLLYYELTTLSSPTVSNCSWVPRFHAYISPSYLNLSQLGSMPIWFLFLLRFSYFVLLLSYIEQFYKVIIQL